MVARMMRDGTLFVLLGIAVVLAGVTYVPASADEPGGGTVNPGCNIAQNCDLGCKSRQQTGGSCGTGGCNHPSPPAGNVCTGCVCIPVE